MREGGSGRRPTENGGGWGGGVRCPLPSTLDALPERPAIERGSGEHRHSPRGDFQADVQLDDRRSLIVVFLLQGEHAAQQVPAQLRENLHVTGRVGDVLRRWRLGGDGVGSAVGLRAELIRHANDYLRRYPGTPWPDVIGACRGLLEAVETSAER